MTYCHLCWAPTDPNLRSHCRPCWRLAKENSTICWRFRQSYASTCKPLLTVPEDLPDA